jgi:hypothetical protein
MCGGTHPSLFDRQLVTFNSFIRSNNNTPPRPVQKQQCSANHVRMGAMQYIGNRTQ